MRTPHPGSKAFTLIELIVVIVILGLLALIAIPTFGKVITRSQDESSTTTLRSIGRESQALRALDQATTWGTIPEQAISDLQASGLGAQAAGGMQAILDDGKTNPGKGQVAYKVIGDNLALAVLSPSQKICVLGLGPSSLGSTKCITPNGTSALSALTVGSDSVLPGGTTSTPAPSPSTPTVTPASLIVGTSSDDTVLAATSKGDTTYIGGYTLGSFPGYTNAKSGTVDAWFAAYQGDKQLWVKQLGTVGNDKVSALTVGADGTIYVAGTTSSSLAGQNPLGSIDGWVAAYTPDGTQKWLKQFGTKAQDTTTSIAVTGSGIVYVGGSTYFNQSTNTTGFDTNLLVASFDTNGNQRWMDQQGTGNDDYIYALTVGSDGTLYAGGTTASTFPGQTSPGGWDGVIVGYNPDGTRTMLKQVGTSGDEAIRSMVFTNGNLYVSGATSGTFPGQTGDADGDTEDAYVASYTTTGTYLWAKQFQTSDYQSNDTLILDGSQLVASGSKMLYPTTNVDVNNGQGGFTTRYDLQGKVVSPTKEFGGVGVTVKGSTLVGSSLVVAGDTTSGLGGKQVGGLDGFLNVIS